MRRTTPTLLNLAKSGQKQLFGYSHDFAAESMNMPAPNIVDARDLTRDLGLDDSLFAADWSFKACNMGLELYDARKYADLLEVAEKCGLDTMMWTRFHQAQNITN